MVGGMTVVVESYRPCANEKRRHRTIRFPLTIFPLRWCVCKDTYIYIFYHPVEYFSSFLSFFLSFFSDQYGAPVGNDAIKGYSIVLSRGIDIRLRRGWAAILCNCRGI